MGSIIDGKALAKEWRGRVKEEALAFEERVGRKARLDVVLVEGDPASAVYVRNKERSATKAGLASFVHRMAGDSTQEQVAAKLKELADDDAVDGILLQLPVPKPLSGDDLVELIPPAKDVDGLHFVNAGKLFAGKSGLRPCTPLGCIELIKTTGIDLSRKTALVIGRSQLVGKPIGQLLLKENATVTMAHSRTQNLKELCQWYDVVVAAAGQQEMVRGDWIKEGAVVIDVGIHRKEDGSLCGDVAFDEAKERASHITPVPGGVGPMTVAMLLRNTVDAANMRLG